MKRAAIFLCAAAICGASLFFVTTNATEARFLLACDGAIKDRLKAPSTYKRISSSFHIQSLNIDQYEKLFIEDLGSATDMYQVDLINRQIENAKKKQFPLELATAYITSEAKNSFGVPIRNNFYCRKVKQGKDWQLTKDSVEIDGQTNLEWAIEGIKQRK